MHGGLVVRKFSDVRTRSTVVDGALVIFIRVKTVVGSSRGPLTCLAVSALNAVIIAASEG